MPAAIFGSIIGTQHGGLAAAMPPEPGLTHQVSSTKYWRVVQLLRADSCRAGANPQTLILMAASWPNHGEVFVGAL